MLEMKLLPEYGIELKCGENDEIHGVFVVDVYTEKDWK